MKLKSLVLLLLASTAGVASAVPVEYVGTVLNNHNWRNYSLVHQGSNPSGAGQRSDWLRFDANQALSFFYDADTGILNTAGLGTQSFDLFSSQGATATFELVNLSLDLNDSDGFLGGSMQYNISGVSGGPIDNVSGGTFQFDNISMGVFNSVNFNGNILEQAYLWGGDVGNGLGIDFSFDGVAVPEPAAILLFGLGLVGLGFTARGKTS